MTEPGSIDVRQQVQLSFKKSFGFCRKGISYRLFRSSLTLAVVVVAVAFFMALLGEGILVRAIGKGVDAEVSKVREADLLWNHLFYPHSSLGLSRKLAGSRGQPERIDEFARVTGLTPEAAATLAEACWLENTYLSFFGDLAIGKRLILVRKNKGRDIFAYLADPAHWAEFTRTLPSMRSVRLPTPTENLRAFLDRWPAYLKSLDAARAAWASTANRLSTRLKELTGEKDIMDWIAGASDAEVERFRQIVVAGGFRLDPETMERVRKRMTIASHERTMTRLLQMDESRTAWKQAFQDLPGLEAQLLLASDPRADAILANVFSAEQRAAVAADFARTRQLRALESELPVRKPTRAGEEAGFLDRSHLFLVIISFIVCMVGITNAMLMAITERFREIATMKCLGATDGFILNQFLIEAAIQGVIGGTLGMLVGLLVALLKCTVLYGVSVFEYFPAWPLLLCAVVTVLLGVLLSMLASIYPSRAAAAMAPMDAMRVE